MDKKIIAILLIASLAIVSSKKHTVEENIKELSSEKHKKGHKQVVTSIPLNSGTQSYSYTTSSGGQGQTIGTTIPSGGSSYTYTTSGQPVVTSSMVGSGLQGQQIVTGGGEPQVIMTNSGAGSAGVVSGPFYESTSGGFQVGNSGGVVVGNTGGQWVETTGTGGQYVSGGQLVGGQLVTGGQLVGGQYVTGGQLVGGQVVTTQSQPQIVYGETVTSGGLVGGQVVTGGYQGGQIITTQSQPQVISGGQIITTQSQPQVIVGETYVSQPQVVTYQSQPQVSEVIYSEQAVVTPGQVVVQETTQPNSVVYTETIEQSYQPAQQVSAQVINERMSAQYPQGTSASMVQLPVQDEIYHETVHVEAGGLDTIYIVLLVLFALCLLSLCLGALLYFLCNKKSRYQGEEQYQGYQQQENEWVEDVQFVKKPKSVRNTHEVINQYSNPVQVQGDAFQVQNSMVQQSTLIPTQQRNLIASQPVQYTGQQIVTSPVQQVQTYGVQSVVGGGRGSFGRGSFDAGAQNLLVGGGNSVVVQQPGYIQPGVITTGNQVVTTGNQGVRYF